MGGLPPMGGPRGGPIGGGPKKWWRNSISILKQALFSFCSKYCWPYEMMQRSCRKLLRDCFKYLQMFKVGKNRTVYVKRRFKVITSQAKYD